MAGAIDVAAFYVQLANLALALFLLKTAYHALRGGRAGFFPRALQRIFVSVAIFAVLEFAMVFGFIQSDFFPLVREAFVLLLLLALLSAAGEIAKGMSAHEHLVKRRLKQKTPTPDVE